MTVNRQPNDVRALYVNFQKERITQLKRAMKVLMAHIRLSGHVQCVPCQEFNNYLLCIRSVQRIPAPFRGEFQRYFTNKLRSVMNDNNLTFSLMIEDADDRQLAVQAPARISSSRVATLINAANRMEDSPSALQPLASCTFPPPSQLLEEIPPPSNMAALPENPSEGQPELQPEWALTDIAPPADLSSKDLSKLGQSSASASHH